MRKNNAKLTITRQTIRTLAAVDLRRAIGGEEAGVHTNLYTGDDCDGSMVISMNSACVPR